MQNNPLFEMSMLFLGVLIGSFLGILLGNLIRRLFRVYLRNSQINAILDQRGFITGTSADKSLAEEYAGVDAIPSPEPLQHRKTETVLTTPSVGVSETLPCGNSTVPSSSTRTHEMDSMTQQNQAPGFPSPSEERSGLTNHAPLPPAWKPRNQDPRILRKHSLGAMFRVLLDERAALHVSAVSSLPPSASGSQAQNQVLEPLPQCGAMDPAVEVPGANSPSQATSGLSDPLWDASPCPHCGKPILALQEMLFDDVWADLPPVISPSSPLTIDH